MTQPNMPDGRAADAVECFLCLADPDAEPAARARWTAWLSASDENRAAYHRVRDTWNRPVPGDLWPSHDDIVNDRYDPAEPIAISSRRRARRRRGAVLGSSSATAWLMPIAAVLLVAVVLLGWNELRPPAPASSDVLAYRTVRGEQRRIALADGSAITLGPLSDLTVPAGGQGRSARLNAGQAIFTIRHDPAQPFKLFANGGEIEDIGTTFAVAIRAERATVTVVEGRVKVSPRAADRSVELGHDEQVSFGQTLGPVGGVDGPGETDWSRGRLAYVDRSLADVVADLTRYTTRDIVLADGTVGALHYTGTIDTDAIDQWAAALTRVFPVGVTPDGNRLVLRSVAKD